MVETDYYITAPDKVINVKNNSPWYNFVKHSNTCVISSEYSSLLDAVQNELELFSASWDRRTEVLYFPNQEEKMRFVLTWSH